MKRRLPLSAFKADPAYDMKGGRQDTLSGEELAASGGDIKRVYELMEDPTLSFKCRSGRIRNDDRKEAK